MVLKDMNGDSIREGFYSTLAEPHYMSHIYSIRKISGVWIGLDESFKNYMIDDPQGMPDSEITPSDVIDPANLFRLDSEEAKELRSALEFVVKECEKKIELLEVRGVKSK